MLRVVVCCCWRSHFINDSPLIGCSVYVVVVVVHLIDTRRCVPVVGSVLSSSVDKFTTVSPQLLLLLCRGAELLPDVVCLVVGLFVDTLEAFSIITQGVIFRSPSDAKKTCRYSHCLEIINNTFQTEKYFI